MPSPELKREPSLGETFSIKVESPFSPPKSHVKEMEIGTSLEFKNAMEQAVSEKFFNAESLRQALAGLTVSFSLEHVPRLDHDLITLGRDVYSAQSWRYVRMHLREGDLFRMHLPEGIKNTPLETAFGYLAGFSISAYESFIEMGIPHEDARYVFLWSFDSNIVVSLQGPKLVDFAIDNLTSPYQAIRSAADEVVETFGQEFPMTAKNLKEVARKEGLSFEDRIKIEEMRAKNLYGYKDEVTVHPLSTDPVKMAAVAAKACYQELAPSEFNEGYKRKEQERILKNIIASGHTSVVEHPHFLVKFAMSEANRQHVRRHRIPIQRALSMWLAAKDYQIVIPPSIESNKKAKEGFLCVWQKSKEFIKEGLEQGIPAPELDHAVIVGIKVPSFLVTNVTDLFHIGRRRLCRRAQWETRDWMYQLAEVLIKKWPVLFESLGPNCFLDECREKESCGRPDLYRKWRTKIESEISHDREVF